MTPKTMLWAAAMAAITFFITPYTLLEITGVTRGFADPCAVGFTAGFAISMLLWFGYVRDLVY